MPTDYLVLGGVVFDDWATPEKIPFGGEQAMKVHKLPGGDRVIDLLGPDQADIRWTGQFWGEDSPGKVATLDAMRISGSPVGLSFAGNSYSVIVKSFTPEVIHFPQQYTYEICCLVTNNPAQGGGGSASTFADLVSADLANALSVVGL